MLPTWVRGGIREAENSPPSSSSSLACSRARAGPALDEARGIVEQAACEAGRNPADIGLEGRVSYAGDLDAALASIENWRAVGATHVTISTMGAGLSGVDSHLAVLRDVASSLTAGL